MRPAIFLSASLPYGERAERYSPDSIAVRDAIRALVAECAGRCSLVFGGHPAITPLVWDVATTSDTTEKVIIYQSKFFEDKIIPKAKGFKNFEWTPIANENDHSAQEEYNIFCSKCVREFPDSQFCNSATKLAMSLYLMRTTMIGNKEFDYRAAIFIGGMNGVEEEWVRFGELREGVPRYPIASTEGAAHLIWNTISDEADRYAKYTDNMKRVFAEETAYRILFREIFEVLGLHRNNS